jgi:hypothetical protein
MMTTMRTLFVLLLTFLLLPVNGSGDVFDGGSQSCDLQFHEQSIALKFFVQPSNLDADQITVLAQDFQTTYNGLTHCSGESLRNIVGVEIVVEQRRRLVPEYWNDGFYLNWDILWQCRGCVEGSELLANDSSRRSLADELSGSGQERSLQDSPCPPCDAPTLEDFIAQFNMVLQEYALANAAADTPDNIIGDIVSVVDLDDSLAHSVCGSFAVHAGTAVAFNGESTTLHGGDVGVSPGTSVTGAYEFHNGGVLLNESSDFAALTVIAHTTAMAVRNDETAIGIEIGGITFTPGTYRSSSAINLAAGTVVTLDGENDPNSVFLFQAVSTLVTGAGTSVVLQNGARAENVLWAVGTAATLGASSDIKGSMLTGSAITFLTNSELHGCALAQSAVTFESGGSIKLTN